MLLYFFIALGLVSGGAILAIAWQQLRIVKTLAATEAPELHNLRALLQRKVDSLYFNFSLFFKRLLHFSYLYSLIGLRRAIIIVRYLLTRIEKKFARLIDSVHGRGVIAPKVPASDFISQIKDHKEAALAGLREGGTY